MTATPNSPSIRNPHANIMYHSRGCGLTHVAMSPISSTTEFIVCRSPIAGGSGSTWGMPPGGDPGCSRTPVAIRFYLPYILVGTEMGNPSCLSGRIADASTVE